MKRMIAAAQPATSGTTFYKITEDQFTKYYSNSDNSIMQYLSESQGFNLIDIDQLYGSEIIDNVLYLCVTDGYDITVGDAADIDPEKALSQFDLDELSEYIKPATDTEIGKYLTPYELMFPDIDNIAQSMFEDDYTFTDILKAAQELDLV